MATSTMADSLAIQRAGGEMLGSTLMVRLIDGLTEDKARGGISAELLHDGFERPLEDAIPLRLLGAVHRIVLDGRAPELARYYPSVGGSDPGDPVPALLTTLTAHREEVERGLQRNVQTNEVGRAAALVGGFSLVARRTGLPLRLLEIGASSGLLLRWDRFRYDTGIDTLGPEGSGVRFDPSWWTAPPPLEADIPVAERAGCDISPIDPTSDDGRLTLLSFVWPDQLERLARLRAALDIAAEVPATVEQADAAAWLATQLAAPAPGRATVVYHSIVWQYLPRETKDAMRSALGERGSTADADTPLAWLRMEPAGAVADLRLTTWPGGEEEVVGTTGYHGRPTDWSAA